MNRHAEVQANNKSIDIQTQSCAGTERYLAREIGIVEEAIVQIFGYLHSRYIVFHSSGFVQVGEVIPVPDVSCIYESSSVEFPDDGETEFEVCFQFDISGVEEVLVIFCRIEITGTIGIRS